MGRPRIDMSGKRFGKLVAMSPLKAAASGTIYWRCKCDCGNISTTDGTKLRKGLTKSCGCLRRKLKNEVGKKFGRLTVIGLNRIDKYAHWNCKCLCGRELVVTGRNLRTNNTESCGCIRSENAGRNAAIRRYIKHAREDDRRFSLSISEIEKLMKANCTYCGEPPSNKSYNKNRDDAYTFHYSGIDRVDSSKGYSRGNVVSCCKWCNISKRERSVTEFKEWLIKTANYIRKWPK